MSEPSKVLHVRNVGHEISEVHPLPLSLYTYTCIIFVWLCIHKCIYGWILAAIYVN